MLLTLSYPEIIPALEICSPHISQSYSISVPTMGNDCNPEIAKQVSLDREVLPYNGYLTLARIRDCYVIQSIPPRIYSRMLFPDSLKNTKIKFWKRICATSIFDFLYVRRGGGSRQLVNESSC